MWSAKSYRVTAHNKIRVFIVVIMASRACILLLCTTYMQICEVSSGRHRRTGGEHRFTVTNSGKNQKYFAELLIDGSEGVGSKRDLFDGIHQNLFRTYFEIVASF